jgi:hypothetical protein
MYLRNFIDDIDPGLPAAGNFYMTGVTITHAKQLHLRGFARRRRGGGFKPLYFLNSLNNDSNSKI